MDTGRKTCVYDFGSSVPSVSPKDIATHNSGPCEWLGQQLPGTENKKISRVDKASNIMMGQCSSEVLEAHYGVSSDLVVCLKHLTPENIEDNLKYKKHFYAENGLCSSVLIDGVTYDFKEQIAKHKDTGDKVKFASVKDSSDRYVVKISSIKDENEGGLLPMEYILAKEAGLAVAYWVRDGLKDGRKKAYMVQKYLGRPLNLWSSSSFEEDIDVAINCVKAVKNIHEKQVIHRDLKSDNMVRDGKGNVSVIDFGLAIRAAKSWFGLKELSEGLIFYNCYHCSPESLEWRNNQYSSLSDVYSLGAMFSIQRAYLNFFKIDGQPAELFSSARSVQAIGSLMLNNTPVYRPHLDLVLIALVIENSKDCSGRIVDANLNSNLQANSCVIRNSALAVQIGKLIYDKSFVFTFNIYSQVPKVYTEKKLKVLVSNETLRTAIVSLYNSFDQSNLLELDWSRLNDLSNGKLKLIIYLCDIQIFEIDVVKRLIIGEENAVIYDVWILIDKALKAVKQTAIKDKEKKRLILSMKSNHDVTKGLWTLGDLTKHFKQMVRVLSHHTNRWRGRNQPRFFGGMPNSYQCAENYLLTAKDMLGIKEKDWHQLLKDRDPESVKTYKVYKNGSVPPVIDATQVFSRG